MHYLNVWCVSNQNDIPAFRLFDLVRIVPGMPELTPFRLEVWARKGKKRPKGSLDHVLGVLNTAGVANIVHIDGPEQPDLRFCGGTLNVSPCNASWASADPADDLHYTHRAEAQAKRTGLFASELAFRCVARMNDVPRAAAYETFAEALAGLVESDLGHPLGLVTVAIIDPQFLTFPREHGFEALGLRDDDLKQIGVRFLLPGPLMSGPSSAIDEVLQRFPAVTVKQRRNVKSTSVVITDATMTGVLVDPKEGGVAVW